MNIPGDQSPSDQPQIVGIKSGSREDLKRVARYQKGVIFCILIQLILGFGISAMPDGSNLEEEPIIVLLLILGVIASTFFVISLAIKVFSTGIGILLGLLTLVPCIGLVVLLLVNIRATRVLRQNGIRVGFFGAKRFAS